MLNSSRAIARALFHSRSPYQGIVPEGHALLVLLYRKKVTLNETSALYKSRNCVMISRHSFCDHCHDKMGGPLSVGYCFINIGDFV